MTTKSTGEFGKALKEVAIIAFGILLAFSLDAWWQDQRTDRDVREALQVVRTEMMSNLDSLAASKKRHNVIIAAIAGSLQAESMDDLYRDALINVEVFDPASGALDTFVSSGMLSAVDDNQLRIALGSISVLTTDLHERETRAVEFRDLARRRGASLGNPVWKSFGDNSVPNDTGEDVELLNLLTMRRAEEIPAVEAASKLEAHLKETLRFLDDYI